VNVFLQLQTNGRTDGRDRIEHSPSEISQASTDIAARGNATLLYASCSSR